MTALLALLAAPAQAGDSCEGSAWPSAVPHTSCHGLAAAIVGSAPDDLLTLRDAAKADLAPVEPTTAAASAEGSSTALSAAPSVQPTGVASGSVAFNGAPDGQAALVAVSLNPFGLAAQGSSSTAATKSTLMRTGDITLLVPAELGGGATPVTYWGLRARLDLASPLAAQAGVKAMDAALAEDAQSEVNIARLETTLSGLSSEQVSACVTALGKARTGSELRADCAAGDEILSALAGVASLQDATFAAEEAFRAAVDDGYAGLDLRADFGDVGDITGTDGDTLHVQGSFAAGKLVAERYLLRGRAGVTYRGKDGEGTAGGDFGAAIGISSPNAGVRSDASLSVGVDGALWWDGGDVTTDVELIIGLVVPMTDSNSLNVGVGIPLSGPDAGTGATVSLSGNWSALATSAGG